MTPLWLQSKYVALLSSRLERFKKTAEHTWNFRCPKCGDSQRKRSRARGYIYEKKGDLNFQCKNCGHGSSFPHFLRDIDPHLYGEMSLEAMQEKWSEGLQETIKAPDVKIPHWQKGLHRICKLLPAHMARRYVERRMLPEQHWGLLFHADNFCGWADSIVPGKFKTGTEPRLVIPFLDKNGEATGFQGRSYDPWAVPRYMSMSLGRGPLIFGLERLKNFDDVILVTEGPFDSLFLDNAISTAGGDLSATLAKLPYPSEKFVIIYDNERRSHTTIQKIQKALTRGYRVCIWPDHILEKDINDMRVCGLEREEINQIIRENNYSGLAGEMVLSQWRRD